MNSENPLLEVKDLHAGYGNMKILANVNLHIGSGEPVALLGTNGSGKSTLLKAISGLVRPTAGVIRFLGKNISESSVEKRVSLGIAMVPESRDLFAKQSVLANLHLGAYLRLRRLGTGDQKDAVKQVVSIFPALEGRLRQVAGTLSGGEQQMVAIGRALMSRPQLLLLDEPSTGLAPLVIAEIFRVLTKLINETALTIFLVEQNTKLALKIVNRGYILETGRIVQSGDAQGLLSLITNSGLKYGRE